MVSQTQAHAQFHTCDFDPGFRSYNSFIHSFVLSFKKKNCSFKKIKWPDNKYLPSTYYTPSAVLGA